MRDKLDLGSYAALVGDHRLPSALVGPGARHAGRRSGASAFPGAAGQPGRGPGPAHRRPAAPPGAAPDRCRRAAGLDRRGCWRTRMQRSPEVAGPMLRNGTIDRWLRRGRRRRHAAAAIDEATRCGTRRCWRRMVGRRDADHPRDRHPRPGGAAGLAAHGDLAGRAGRALDHALHTRRSRPTAGRDRDGAGGHGLGGGAAPGGCRRRRLENLETRHWFTGGAQRTGAWRLCYQLNPLSLASRRRPPVPGRRGCPTCCPRWRPCRPGTARRPAAGRPADRRFIEARRDERLDWRPQPAGRCDDGHRPAVATAPAGASAGEAATATSRSSASGLSPRCSRCCSSSAAGRGGSGWRKRWHRCTGRPADADRRDAGRRAGAGRATRPGWPPRRARLAEIEASLASCEA